MCVCFPGVKRGHTLSLHLGFEGVFEDGLALGVLDLVAVLAEGGHLLDHADRLVPHRAGPS